MEAYLVVFDSCRLSHSLFRNNGCDFSNRWETKKGNLGFFCGCGAYTRRCNPWFPICEMKLGVKKQKNRMRVKTHPIKNMAGLAGFEPA